MPVEIREITIGAQIVEPESTEPPPPFDPEELRQQILAECEALIRRTLERLGER
ncbi:MAG: hypothetical protein JO107_04655 [Hyphomicrobiales bacterium]|nr:hypothetical protein [Hyphomicrobiales bacterium]